MKYLEFSYFYCKMLHALENWKGQTENQKKC